MRYSGRCWVGGGSVCVCVCVYGVMGILGCYSLGLESYERGGLLRYPLSYNICSD